MAREQVERTFTFPRRTAELLKSCGIVDLQHVTPLAKGWHHIAYRYTSPEGKHHVIKVPRVVTTTGIVHSGKQETENARVVSEAFGSHAVPTTVLQSEKGYVVIMDEIHGKPIHADMVNTASPLCNTELRHQLVDIIEANKQLSRESGKFLDLTGAHALFEQLGRPIGKKRSKTLANLFVEIDSPTNQPLLRIIDNDLIPIGKGNKPFERFKSLVVFIANYQTIKQDFGLDIRPNKPTTRSRRPY